MNVIAAGAQSPGLEVNAAVGAGTTLTVKLCTVLHPFASVTVALYVVVVVGDTLCVKPFGKLLSQLTVYGPVPPDGVAVIVVVPLAQIVLLPESAIATAVGSVMVYVFVTLQPPASLMVTTY